MRLHRLRLHNPAKNKIDSSFQFTIVLQTADSEKPKELFIILPQTSYRFQSNEAPLFK